MENVLSLLKPLSTSTKLKVKSSSCTSDRRRNHPRLLASEVGLAARATIMKTAAAVIRATRPAIVAALTKSLKVKRKGCVTDVSKKRITSEEISTSIKLRVQTIPAAALTATTKVRGKTAEGF